MRALFLFFVFLVGCVSLSDEDNTPASKHEKLLSSSASMVSASLVVIKDNSSRPEVVQREAELALTLTGVPRPDDLAKAKERAKNPAPAVYIQAAQAAQGLRAKTMETAKSGVAEKIELKKGEAEVRRNQLLNAFGIGLMLLSGVLWVLVLRTGMKPAAPIVAMVLALLFFLLGSVL